MKTLSGISQLSTISFRPATCSFEAISRLNSISKFAKFCVIYSFFQGFLRFDFWPVPGPAGSWAGREQAWRDRTGQGGIRATLAKRERAGLSGRGWGTGDNACIARLRSPAGRAGHRVLPDSARQGEHGGGVHKTAKIDQTHPRNSSKHTILQFYVQARTNSQQAKEMSATQPAKTAARSNPLSLLAELSPALCPRELAARPPGISGPSSRDDGIPA